MKTKPNKEKLEHAKNMLQAQMEDAQMSIFMNGVLLRAVEKELKKFKPEESRSVS